MKRFVLLLVLMVSALLFLPMIALAEGAVGAVAAFDWVYLGSIAGATAATLLVVQYMKAPLDKVWKIPTRLFALIIAFMILLAAQAATTGLTWEGVPLIVLNAFVVALAAMGTYEVTYAKKNTE